MCAREPFRLLALWFSLTRFTNLFLYLKLLGRCYIFQKKSDIYLEKQNDLRFGTEAEQGVSFHGNGSFEKKIIQLI